jgi:hypothetical protein
MENTQSKAENARALIKAGTPAREVAALVGTSLQYIYDIKSRMNKNAGLKPTRGRPRKNAATPAANVGDPRTEPPNVSARQRIDNLESLMRIREREINDLTAVIDYLEHRLKKHGTAI